MNKKWLKLNEMDAGTILRTILAVATSLNTALLATDLTGFDNPTVDFWYKIISIILNFIIVAIATYMNNDYTKGASVGTVVGRKINEDPTAIVEVVDGDATDEDDDEEDEDPGESDETIEEGE